MYRAMALEQVFQIYKYLGLFFVEHMADTIIF